MLFYSTLLIASLVLTLVLLWLYNIIVLVSKKIGESRGRAKNRVPTAHLDEKKYGRNVKKAGKAWAAYGHASPANIARTHPAQITKSSPWGWPGSSVNSEGPLSASAAEDASLNAYLEKTSFRGKSVTDWKMNVGRPIRDGGRALAGKAYSPSKDIMDKFADEDDDRQWSS